MKTPTLIIAELHLKRFSENAALKPIIYLANQITFIFLFISNSLIGLG